MGCRGQKVALPKSHRSSACCAILHTPRASWTLAGPPEHCQTGPCHALFLWQVRSPAASLRACRTWLPGWPRPECTPLVSLVMHDTPRIANTLRMRFRVTDFTRRSAASTRSSVVARRRLVASSPSSASKQHSPCVARTLAALMANEGDSNDYSRIARRIRLRRDLPPDGRCVGCRTVVVHVGSSDASSPTHHPPKTPTPRRLEVGNSHAEVRS